MGPLVGSPSFSVWIYIHGFSGGGFNALKKKTTGHWKKNMIGRCGGLNENNSHRLKRNDIIRRDSLVGGSLLLRINFEVSGAQARPSATLCSYCWSLWM